MFGVKCSRGKLRALSVVKNKADCPEGIKKLAHRVHVNADVVNRNRKQLNARVSFFLRRAEDLEIIKESAINKFGEVVVKDALIKHRADVESVQIAGLCSDLSESQAMAILNKIEAKSQNAISINYSRGTCMMTTSVKERADMIRKAAEMIKDGRFDACVDRLAAKIDSGKLSIRDLPPVPALPLTEEQISALKLDGSEQLHD